MVLEGRAEIALAPDEYSGLVMVLLRMLAFAPAEVRATPTAPPTPSAGARRGPARERAGSVRAVDACVGGTARAGDCLGADAVRGVHRGHGDQDGDAVDRAR